MYIINPPSSYVPKYRIGPFRTIDISINNELPIDDSIDHYLDVRFGVGNYSYHFRARRALNMALQHYNLKEEDEVAIFTTTNNLYISSCVTKEIDKFCKWNRKITERTKIIFVNHEFGIPFDGVNKLQKYGLPIIEDCSHSFYSRDKNGDMGTIGDFAIYSFPKMFPVQIGGLLVSNIKSEIEKNKHLDQELLRNLKNVLSYYIKQEQKTINKRIENYNKLANKLNLLGFIERFELESGMIPGVFMFTIKDSNINLEDLKIHVQRHGIESSVFYGERAFFIPVHQYLNDHDMEYFVFTLQNFLEKK